LTSATEALSYTIDSTEKCVGSTNKMSMADHLAPSEDADMKQFDKLFVELVAESTACDDPKVADAMKWFKEASRLQSICILNFLVADRDNGHGPVEAKMVRAEWCSF